MAEREGFEPSVPFWGTHAFQACTFNHSDISPCKGNYRGSTGNMSKPLGIAFGNGGVCRRCSPVKVGGFAPSRGCTYNLRIRRDGVPFVLKSLLQRRIFR